MASPNACGVAACVMSELENKTHSRTHEQRELTYSAYLIVAGPDSRKLERRIPSAQRDFTYSAHLVAPGHLYPLQLLLVLIV